jgi:hypothetical protein
MLGQLPLDSIFIVLLIRNRSLEDRLEGMPQEGSLALGFYAVVIAKAEAIRCRKDFFEGWPRDFWGVGASV